MDSDSAALLADSWSKNESQLEEGGIQILRDSLSRVTIALQQIDPHART
jgi:hypothetical protein